MKKSDYQSKGVFLLNRNRSRLVGNQLSHVTCHMSHVRQKGALLIQILVIGAVAAIVIAALVQWVGVNLVAARTLVYREQAFQIAEAGVEYYRWVLAHNAQDFEDGTGGPGPYVHEYYNKDGELIGHFSLEIMPPPSGSTQVVIRSTGTVLEEPTVERVLQVVLGVPSFTRYAIVTDSVLRVGEGTETQGLIHANGGVRFDGLAYNIVSSALAEYHDPDHADNKEFGVHTHLDPIDPEPPAEPPARPDVFGAGRAFPIPAVNFNDLTIDLDALSDLAEADGGYVPPSDALGYHIVLRTDKSFDLYRVDSLVGPPNGCTQPQGQFGWGTWSIAPGGESFIENRAVPTKGVLFVEDHVWVDGQVADTRLTIAVGKFPENQGQGRNIIVNEDLLYTYYDGRDAVGLIAQENFNVGLVSGDNLSIDAAVIAKNGRAGRHYYRPPTAQPRCSPYHARSSLTLYGMLASKGRYGFAYSDGTGYQDRDIIYDPNLLYAPPPSFPLVGESYQTESWREL
ncbi:MAG: hypothetical protein COV10_01205 [Candidatus Vogelbacteria bacterium CG10_big_fil_rev_8_21_14_0_10_51_16]|uniref:Type 4 fimbrial biogenesis protein PilX N-terminal domain-containing protein n=1 Tax=Candidatus Vogelbacteria bacterium CG10_big_fil_rev_8_21_14_0_10_51_16 TaxID=1975045 RepID=A0A2H0RH80_9BACT|nr:MAG: hypothetical protein COV10_01205 [Candidatus Vogelbacteria bacterium CG10_big_fil_rev_8_21_14_0_10_51_16]